MNTLTIISIVLVATVFWFIFTYNRFVSLRNRAKEAWSDIDIQLKRRYDLIPNLVETVKGYAGHERELLEKITQARARAITAEQSGNPKEIGQAENFLSSTLKSLFAVSENYPDLKASVNFLELQRELRDAEDKVQAARRFYNTNARDLNTKTESFPDKVIAGTFGFKSMEFFEIGESAEKETPKVNF